MNEQQHLETLSDIKRMMERSSRFISLSGLSGISAGITALVGGAVAHSWLKAYYDRWESTRTFSMGDFEELKIKLIVLAGVVLCVALLLGTFFTWRRASRNGLPIWDATSRKVLINVAIPLAAGGAFIGGLLFNHLEVMIAPTCLVFYGLALVNASKYTLSDIRYLGITEIILGVVNLFFLRRGLYFWLVGFGILHIIYGALMWWKYERQPAA
jgi:membrane protein implicated in regulation of membrane protease activity